MSIKLLLLILSISWLSFRDSGLEKVAEIKMVIDSPPECPGRGWCMGPKAIGICTMTQAKDRNMVIAHEVDHALVYEYGLWRDVSWKFEDEAWTYLKQARLSNRQRALVWKFSAMHPSELHAQLPYILYGKIPPELAKWYPWLDTGAAKEKQWRTLSNSQMTRLQ